MATHNPASWTVAFRVAQRLGRLGLLLLGTAISLAIPASAAITAKDVQIAGRVLTFMSPPPSGNVKIGIVYDPKIAGSAADEQSLAAIIGNGLQIEGIYLIAVPVKLENLSSAQVDVYFLTSDLGDDALKVGARAAAEHRLCITTDLSATQAGSCAVAVRSQPTVQITINSAAAKNSGIGFVTAFLLMVTEI